MALDSQFDLKPIASILWVLENARRDAASDIERDWIQSTINHAIRQIEKFVNPEVSVKAFERAVEMKIGSLHNLKWADQKLKMKDLKRSIFHWEHVLPVSDASKRLRSAKTAAEVKEILCKVDIAWILKCENSELDKGNRSKRDPNPWDTYEKKGIYMIKRS